MITGGGAMHLNDSIGREKRIQYICNHHEQACAMAAEGYARITGKLGVVNVTSGPGGINALNGVFGAWTDSTPMLIISGQVRYDTTVSSTGLKMRQYGDQEADIINIVKTITKYSVMITDPNSIKYHLQKALFLATHGRPGPVWIDIPLDVQASMIDEEKLISYYKDEDEITSDLTKIENQVDHVIEKIISSERPVIIGGSGIHSSGSVDIFHKVIDLLKIPVQTSWKAIDLLPSDHPLYYGRPSTIGQRSANIIFQNADLLLNIGSRFSIRQIGYNYKSVLREAYKVSVDIDENELKKPSFTPDFPILVDIDIFLKTFLEKLNEVTIPYKEQWITWCETRKKRFPVMDEYTESKEHINPYHFCDVLSDVLDYGEIIVSSNGSSCVIPIQVMKIKRGQRYVVNSGCASMGYGLPAAIGACFANNKKRVICFEGDGSIQMNIQELQTIVHHKLPIKIFIFNNNGYLSIRTTQTNFFNKNFIGESFDSGVSFPDMIKIASAYGIKNKRISDNQNIKNQIINVLSEPGPVLCDVCVDPNQTFAPKVSSHKLPDGKIVSRPLEDMYPFLSREDLKDNMLIPVLGDK